MGGYGLIGSCATHVPQHNKLAMAPSVFLSPQLSPSSSSLSHHHPRDTLFHPSPRPSRNPRVSTPSSRRESLNTSASAPSCDLTAEQSHRNLSYRGTKGPTRPLSIAQLSLGSNPLLLSPPARSSGVRAPVQPTVSSASRKVANLAPSFPPALSHLQSTVSVSIDGS